MVLLSADLESGEAVHGHTSVGHHLGDGFLVVASVGLIEQCDLLVERTETSFDDLRESRFRLALGSGDLFDDTTLVLDSLSRDIVTEIAKGEGKPEAALPKIIEGRVNGFFKQVALLDQDYAKDNKLSVARVLTDADLTVTGFARFKVGA